MMILNWKRRPAGKMGEAKQGYWLQPSDSRRGEIPHQRLSFTESAKEWLTQPFQAAAVSVFLRRG